MIDWEFHPGGAGSGRVSLDGMNWTSAGAFFKDPTFEFETRAALGLIAQGIGDAGLVFATMSQVTDGDATSWFDAWSATAGSLTATTGHPRHVQWAQLTACDYFAKAQVVADDDAIAATFGRQQAAFEAYIDASAGTFVRMPIPYEGSSLPGYLLRPDDSAARRPTLIMTNGSDTSLASLIAHGGPEALARGWNVFVYDGPGQQSMLFERGVPFRPDWEAVLTPVVDALLARPEVDPDALLGYAVSQGGYWLPRALAFEKRLVAAVLDGGVVDVGQTWNAQLPADVLEMVHRGQKEAFDTFVDQVSADPRMARELRFRSRPYGRPDAFGTLAEVQKYQLRDVVGQITTPLLVLDPDDEQFFPGQSAELARLLPGVAELVHYTAANGANWHCQPMAKATVVHHFLDWLGTHVPAPTTDEGK